jgi:hypothetical protein
MIIGDAHDQTALALHQTFHCVVAPIIPTSSAALCVLRTGAGDPVFQRR